jgi:hypothetical protein
MDNKSSNNDIYHIGVSVFILLVALTIGEYAIGTISPVWIAPLFGVAILKAYLIARDYMHVGRLFSGDEEEHS